MKSLQIFEYEGKRISFDFGNGQKMVNATEMAKIFKKPVGNFLRLRQTKDFIKLLNHRYSDVNSGNDYKALNVVMGGNDRSLQGTWMDEKLALKFAAWLNPNFELWVWDTIHNLLTDGMINAKDLKWRLQKIQDDAQEIFILSDLEQIKNIGNE